MRICLIGEYTSNPDEGMRIITAYFYKELSKTHEIMKLDLKNISFNWIKKIRQFNPDIIHYTQGPSLMSLVIIRALAFFSNAKTVASATQPRFSSVSRIFISFLKPDLILTQSDASDKIFKNANCQTKFLPNGVGTEKFFPVSTKIKKELKEKYDINKDKFVVLHVGPITRGRNLEIFTRIQEIKEIQVIIVGSKSMPMDGDTYEHLMESGCKVWRRYFSNIEEIYQLSDCYIFPTTNVLSSIEIPLSVLEAMSCNLPVISTKFGALPQMFDEGEGLVFVDTENKISDASITGMVNQNCNTKSKVTTYSWDKVIKKLEEIYKKLISNKITIPPKK